MKNSNNYQKIIINSIAVTIMIITAIIHMLYAFNVFNKNILAGNGSASFLVIPIVLFYLLFILLAEGFIWRSVFVLATKKCIKKYDKTIKILFIILSAVVIYLSEGCLFFFTNSLTPGFIFIIITVAMSIYSILDMLFDLFKKKSI